MTEDEITALAQKWEAAAERAEIRYQESGQARHLREKENAEDLAAALWIAADAAADYNERLSLRCDLNGLAAKAHAALDALPAADRADDRTILTDLAREVVSTARLYGVDSRREGQTTGRRSEEDKPDADHQN